jgi:hypothetical protein
MKCGPICLTLSSVMVFQDAAMNCARQLAQARDLPLGRYAGIRAWQGLYLADAHVLMCLVASAATPSNDARFGDAARSTPR